MAVYNYHEDTVKLQGLVQTHPPSDYNPVSDIDTCRLLNSKEFSDVHIKILGQGDDFDVHAHKVILAAGSGYFQRELRLPKYNVNPKSLRY